MDLELRNLTVEWVAIERLYCSPSNPRRNDEAVPHVASSIRRFGWQQPIVARPSGEVIAGNTRLKAALNLGLAEVPVAWFEGSDLEGTAYQVADNRTHEFADWDEAGLAKILEQLRTEDALEGVGFDSADIDELLAQLEADSEPNELDDPGPGDRPEAPVSQPGDIWLLGEHRVLCGDSTSESAVQRVLGGLNADLVWTDPPYGVAYVGKTEDALKIANDSLDDGQLEELLSSSLGLAAQHSKPGAVWYVSAPAGPNFLPFARVLHRLGIWRQTLVWVKDVFVLGRSDFHYRHEALFYGWTPGAAHREPPDRMGDTVWEFDRPRASPDHPTCKPVDLVSRALERSSLPGDLVLDPFLGSGTTLLAAEATGRRCAGLELDPRYVDVIVRRWKQATGLKAMLDGMDQTFEQVAAERAS